MDPNEPSYQKDVSFLEKLEREYPRSRDILSALFTKCDEYLEAKNHNGLIGLVDYTVSGLIQLTAETRFLCLIVQSLSIELTHNSDTFFVDSYQDHVALLNGYRKVTLLLRRLELFSPDEELYLQAVSELSSLALSPYIVKTILTNELFDDPESLSHTIYETFWSLKAIPERFRYALCFLEEYDCNYWKLTCADILLSISEYKSALDYLKKLSDPGKQEKELISSLEALINE